MKTLKRMAAFAPAALWGGLSLCWLCGCGMVQRANPASRTNGYTFAPVIRVEGGSNTVSVTVNGDGLLADASGGGDALTSRNDATQDIRPSTTVSVPSSTAGGFFSSAFGLLGSLLDSRASSASSPAVTSDGAKSDGGEECTGDDCKPAE